jgi:hypothetical protein
MNNQYNSVENDDDDEFEINAGNVNASHVTGGSAK